MTIASKRPVTAAALQEKGAASMVPPVAIPATIVPIFVSAVGAFIAMLIATIAYLGKRRWDNSDDKLDALAVAVAGHTERLVRAEMRLDLVEEKLAELTPARVVR